MTAIIAMLGSKLGLIGIGAAMPIIFMLAKKFIPSMIGKFFSKELGLGMSKIDGITDPTEKELVRGIALAIVKYAEYKLPDKEKGKEKYHMVAEKLCALIPFLKGRNEDIEDIIENAVQAMDDELKRLNP